VREQKQKDTLIASLPAVTSALKTGDVAIFDSRSFPSWSSVHARCVGTVREGVCVCDGLVCADACAGACAWKMCRLLHCGDANSSSKRRVLFYFTLSKQQNWPLPNGLHGLSPASPLHALPLSAFGSVRRQTDDCHGSPVLSSFAAAHRRSLKQRTDHP